MKRSAAEALVVFPLCLAALAAQARAGQGLAVRDCVALARARAPEVRIARAASLAARQDSVGHSFDQRPTFSLFGGATVAPDGYYDPALTNLGEYELKVGMEWPLRDAGVCVEAVKSGRLVNRSWRSVAAASYWFSGGSPKIKFTVLKILARLV